MSFYVTMCMWGVVGTVVMQCMCLCYVYGSVVHVTAILSVRVWLGVVRVVVGIQEDSCLLWTLCVPLCINAHPGLQV